MVKGRIYSSSALTGRKSANMKADWSNTNTSKWTDDILPYAETKTPVKGLKSVSFNAKVSDTRLKIDVFYSTNGSDWNKIGLTATELQSTSKSPLEFNIPSSNADEYYYIRIAVSSSSRHESSSSDYYTLTIDDVEFTYSGTTIPIPTSEGYGTFYYPETFVMPDNLQGAVAEVENNTLRWNWMYNAGDAVPAGTPILVRRTDGEETSFVADVTENSGTAPSSNYLYANTGNTATEASAIAPSAAKYYALSYNTSGQNLGFYYRVADGASFAVPVGKVFLALPAGTEVKSFSDVSDENSIKGIEYKKNDATYDIAGRRIGNVQRGIYIVNGHKLVR